MPESYKKLAAIAPTNGEEKFLYAAPPNTSSLVSNITVANRSASATTFDINIYQSGITQQSDIDNSDVGKKFFIAAVGGEGGMKTSTNGTTWISAGQGYTEFSGKVLYGNGIYIVPTGNSAVARVSTDGITWTDRSAAGLSQKIRGAAFGAGIFVWSASDNRSQIATSTNGTTWVSRTLPANGIWNSIVYASNNFVAVAESGAGGIATSTNGTTWTQRTLPASLTATRTEVVYGGGSFVIITGGSNQAAHSTDSITWTQQTLPVTLAGDSNPSGSSLAHGNGVFAAISYGSAAAASSTDGITWTARTLAILEYCKDVEYGNGVFTTTSYNRSTSHVSTNGTTWTTYAGPGGQVNRMSFVGPYISPNINKLYSSSAIDANETLVLEPGIVLSASSSIVIKDGSAGNLTFSTYGVELS
jgi:hypothetical protein